MPLWYIPSSDVPYGAYNEKTPQIVLGDIVPKKIVNPLRAGLPSKIYLLSFNGPISGYKIAEKIYGRKYAPTSKIYPWTKKLEEQGFIHKVQEGYVSNVEPVLSEIEETSETDEKLEFSDLHKHILHRIVDSKEFRSYVLESNEGLSLKQDIDAFWIISSSLGKLAFDVLLFSAWMEIDFKVESQEVFDKTWENLRTIRERNDLSQIATFVQNEDLRKELTDVVDTQEGRNDARFLIDILPFFAVPEYLLSSLLRFSHQNKLSTLILFFLDYFMSHKLGASVHAQLEREKLYAFSESRLMELSKKYPEAIKELLGENIDESEN
jgi:hypothetical protein